MTPSMVDSVNSHATSTPSGDVSEAYALSKIFGNKKISNSLKLLEGLD
jgi:3-oxoacyl-(acyl-carrier-protein) synthase